MAEINTEQYVLDMLNDSHDTITIAGMDFEAGRILQEVDPIAFRETETGYIDSMVKDGQWFEWADGSIHDEPEDEDSDDEEEV